MSLDRKEIRRSNVETTIECERDKEARVGRTRGMETNEKRTVKF